MRTLLRDLGTVSGVQCACIVRGGEVLASTFPEADAVAQAASLGFVRGISDGLELVDRGFEELLIDFEGRSLMVAPVAKDFVLAMLAAPEANTQLLRVVMGSSVRQLRRMSNIAEKPEPAAAAKPEAATQPRKTETAAPAPKPAPPAAPPPPPPFRPQPAAAAPAAAPQAAKAPPTGRPQPPQTKPAPPPPPPLRGQQPARPPQPAPAPPPKPAAKPEPAPAPAPAAAKAADRDAEPILPQVLALLTEYIGPVARVSFKRGVQRWRETGTPTVGTLGELAKILATDLSSDSEKKAFLDAVERLRGG